MSLLDQYDRDEQPVVKRVLLDLALQRVSTVHIELYRTGQKFTHEYDIEREAVRIWPVLRDAEDFLREAVGRGPASLFPWNSGDFFDFWQHGGDVRALKSMTEYVAQMPEWYRLVAEAEAMPADYGKVLTDSIPEWSF